MPDQNNCPYACSCHCHCEECHDTKCREEWEFDQKYGIEPGG